MAAPHGATAQDSEYLRLKWWHPLAASAGVAVLFLADQPVHDYVQDHQSREQDDLANIAKRFHDSRVFLVAGTGTMAVGLLARELTVAQTGLQILASYGLASGMMIATK